MPVTGTPVAPGTAPSVPFKTLLQMRRRLVELSGHFELVLDAAQNDWGDNGADDYIRAAQRFLDDQFQYHKSEAWLYKKLTAGESLVTFNNARIIKEVWISNATGFRTMLQRMTPEALRKEHNENTLAAITNGTPEFWTPGVTMLAPSQIAETAVTFAAEGLTDYDLIVFSNDYLNKSVYIMPTVDVDTTVEILAEWKSAELTNDEDVSYWSQFPELLIRAARMEIEVDLHRNSTGRRDFEDALMPRLSLLNDNLRAEEQSGPSIDFVMQG